MDTDSPDWFLLKSDDNSIFGPVSLVQMKTWAHEAQISPLDKISTDQLSWVRAPMVSGLGMDWLVSVTAEQLYGPTTLGAIVLFLVQGEINEDTQIINACDGTRHRLGDIAERETVPDAEESTEDNSESMKGPGRSGIKTSLQQRILDLETALLEERRALARLEASHKKLTETYATLTGAPWVD